MTPLEAHIARGLPEDYWDYACTTRDTLDAQYGIEYCELCAEMLFPDEVGVHRVCPDWTNVLVQASGETTTGGTDGGTRSDDVEAGHAGTREEGSEDTGREPVGEGSEGASGSATAGSPQDADAPCHPAAAVQGRVGAAGAVSPWAPPRRWRNVVRLRSRMARGAGELD